MPKKETFTSRFEETRGGRVPQKSKIWGDVVYGQSLSENQKKKWALKIQGTLFTFLVLNQFPHVENVGGQKYEIIKGQIKSKAD